MQDNLRLSREQYPDQSDICGKYQLRLKLTIFSQERPGFKSKEAKLKLKVEN